jgi:DNA topoisomerase-2
MKIYFNDELINIKNFEDYIKLFYTEMPNYVYQTFNERWDIGVVYDTTKDHKTISFVNRISTIEGGTHVNYIKDQLVKKVKDELKTKFKNLVKPSIISENLTLFINTTIEDPDFGSQSKETLKTKSENFKVPCELDDKFIKKICKTGLLDEIIKTIEAKNENEIKKKTDSSKNDNLRGIIKLDDANWAGTKKSNQCYLILTEGDSAKALATCGKLNRDIYGIFPLKGKPLNVREATKKQLIENEELCNIKKIIGLKQNTTDISKLRYRGIIIMADADVDGIHIRGLLINLFHTFWRNLIDDNFIITFPTPVVRAIKNSDKNKNKFIDFYSLNDYNEWSLTVNQNQYKIKYYKGLGTWDRKEAVQIFENFETKLITYNNGDNLDENKKLTDESVILAFSKSHANNRKDWLKTYNPKLTAVVNNNTIQISEFVNKELIHFSTADNIRSIPDLCDGLKPSQRKVLFGVFEKKLDTTEIKVSQLAGYISERTEYHHGEASLFLTIIGMAQDFWCSNNINLLKPNGQFGTRFLGGNDSASPRYIYTQINPITRLIFRQEDEQILNYVCEENRYVEPEKYYPVVPLCLINNISGIGTGYSTAIPGYNPKEVINNIKLLLNNEEGIKMYPWVKFFIGDIVENNNKKKITDPDYITYGKYKIIDENTIVIYELPIGVWTSSYKQMLELMIQPLDESKEKSNYIYDFKEDHLDLTVKFTVKFYNGQLQQLIKKNEDCDIDYIMKELKLISHISTKNMHLFHNNVITKFNDPLDIIRAYIPIRLQKYEERRLNIIKTLEHEMLILKYTKKYIEDILNEIIIINKQKKDVIIQRLEELQYPKIITTTQEPSYEYLTKLLIFNLTFEKIEEINNKYNLKQDELNYYLKITNTKLWLKELDELNDYYDVWYQGQLDEFNGDTSQNTKQITTKSKKTKK